MKNVIFVDDEPNVLSGLKRLLRPRRKEWDTQFYETGAEVLEFIAENPFYTTKEVCKGTGQGLSMAFATIVDKHGGSIQFESEPGVGTTF